MARSDFTPDRVDRVTWTVTAFCVAGWIGGLALNGLTEFGALAHDVFCPRHGWAV